MTMSRTGRHDHVAPPGAGPAGSSRSKSVKAERSPISVVAMTLSEPSDSRITAPTSPRRRDRTRGPPVERQRG